MSEFIESIYRPSGSGILMSRGQVATELNLAHRTLTNWGSLGVGPKFHRVRGRVVYLRADVEAWAKADLEAILGGAA